MYNVAGGSDLSRLAYLPDFYKNTKEKLSRNDETIRFYSDFYTDSLKHNYDLLIIGDSFSDAVHTFSNKLAKKKSVLVVKGQNEKNPIQRLSSLINSGFFDTINVKEVLLESVERYVVERALSTNLCDSSMQNNVIDKTLITNTSNANISKPKHDFFSSQPLYFGFNTLRHLLCKDVEFNSTVQQYSLTKKLFSYYKSKSILVLKEDIQKLYYNNDSKKIYYLNNVLNLISKKLKNKNVGFNVMICPDKYDLYYDFFVNNNNYKRPHFFQKLYACKQEYNFIPVFSILRNQLDKNVQDLYLYDDTHWSTKSVCLITKYLERYDTSNF